jgi:Tfp pilus assembly protein FimT
MKIKISQKGISIIELLIVLTVTAILVTFALTSFTTSKSNITRQNFARELKVSLERARSDSIKRRATDANSMALVKIDSATSFSVATDLNQNQIIDSSEIKQTNLAGSGVKIVGSSLVFPVTIKFDRRGFMTATNGSGTDITVNLTVCESCTASTANSKNSNIISVSPTGTVLMLDGGKTPPVFQNPVVTTVSSGSQINPVVVVD